MCHFGTSALTDGIHAIEMLYIIIITWEFQNWFGMHRRYHSATRRVYKFIALRRYNMVDGLCVLIDGCLTTSMLYTHVLPDTCCVLYFLRNK